MNIKQAISELRLQLESVDDYFVTSVVDGGCIMIFARSMDALAKIDFIEFKGFEVKTVSMTEVTEINDENQTIKVSRTVN